MFGSRFEGKLLTLDGGANAPLSFSSWHNGMS